jgi:excinuclease ABC subunit C
VIAAPVVAEKLAALPAAPGVYQFIDGSGRVLYVGKATDLRSRVRSYFAGEGPADRARIRLLLPSVADLAVFRTQSGREALLLENSLIKKHRPPGNVRLRDDRNYLCIRVDTHHDFPRIAFLRKFFRDGARWFGPYSDGRAVREAVRAVQAACGLRVCSDHVLENRARPCLYFEMGRCTAPCVGRITREEYAVRVRAAIDALRGRADEVVGELTAKMERFAADLRFEKAAEVRDQIAALERTGEKQSVILPDLVARDVVHLSRRGEDLSFLVLFVREGKLLSSRHYLVRSDAGGAEAMAAFLGQFYGEGKAIPPEVLCSEEPEGRALLEEWLGGERGGSVKIRVPERGAGRALLALAAQNAAAAAESPPGDEARERGFAGLDALAERLDLPRPPSRIECFDVSTIGGTATVASLVTFEEGRPDKKGYRRYRVRTVSGPDDFAAMREVLARRFARAGEMPLPDLLIVDGGPGQLGKALEALREAGAVDLSVAGLAKARRGEGGKREFERIWLPGREEPVLLPPGEPETLLVARVRDEAHRFAISYHRKVRGKLGLESLLDRVEGVGKAWRNRLLTRFGSVEAIREAPLDDLLTVPGLPRGTARRIHEFLRAEKPDGA